MNREESNNNLSAKDKSVERFQEVKLQGLEDVGIIVVYMLAIAKTDDIHQKKIAKTDEPQVFY